MYGAIITPFFSRRPAAAANPGCVGKNSGYSVSKLCLCQQYQWTESGTRPLTMSSALFIFASVLSTVLLRELSSSQSPAFLNLFA